MRILLILITLLSLYSSGNTHKSPDIIDYVFLDSITLTDYSISIPAYANCGEINSTKTLLSCFPELKDVLGTIDSMSEMDLKSLESEPDPYYEYAPDGLHLYFFEVFTEINKKGDSDNLVVKYSLHPRGGTMIIDAGTLSINR
jgi:hypothetical protein